MQSNRKKTKKIPTMIKNLLRMLAKQTVASLLCLLIALGMQSATFSPLSTYADALGRALRHESNFSKLVQAGGQIADKLRSLFSLHEETSL